MNEIGLRPVSVGVEDAGSGELIGQLSNVDAVDAKVSEGWGHASDEEDDE